MYFGYSCDYVGAGFVLVLLWVVMVVRFVGFRVGMLLGRC